MLIGYYICALLHNGAHFPVSNGLATAWLLELVIENVAMLGYVSWRMLRRS